MQEKEQNNKSKKENSKDSTPKKNDNNISNTSISNLNNDKSKSKNQTNLNITKLSNDESSNNDFKELNKEIFSIIQQGNNVNNLSNNLSNCSNNNNSNSIPPLNDNTWLKKVSPDNSSSFDKKMRELISKNQNKNNQNLTNNKIESIDFKNTMNSNFEINENNIEDDIPFEDERINKLHYQLCNSNNLNYINNNNNTNNNNNNINLFQINNSLFSSDPFIPKSKTINEQIINSQNNKNNFNIYYTNNNQYNNYYYPSFNFPENAFTFNKNPHIINEEQIYQTKKKNKKFRDKFEQTFFTINIEQILKGYELRTTVMIRHIPNKYTSKDLLNEIDIACKGKYDFFYLPLDTENDCNLGYSFINFIDPLHIVYFYHLFKARNWNHYKSHKECDLSFAKFQGKIELTAHLEKNMNKMEDKKKLPMIFEINSPFPKIDLPVKYFDFIKINRRDIMQNINFV